MFERRIVMYSMLAKAEYEYKDMCLKDLKNRIMEENNLTDIDIIKGYHELAQNMRMQYKNPLTDDEINFINTLVKEYNDLVCNKAESLANEIYNKHFNEIFKPFEEIYKQYYPNEDVLSVISTKEGVKSIKNKEVKIRDAYIRFYSAIEYYIKFKLSDDIRDTIFDMINENHKDGDIKISSCKCTQVNYLPWYINLNQLNLEEEQYKNMVWEYTEENPMDKNMFFIIHNFDFKFYNQILSDISIYKSLYFYIHLSHERTKKIIIDTINNYIQESNVINEITYLQNLEAQPITININTKTNRYELIDGYKRLLYVNSDDLLSLNAPIRIFTDLSDSSFLAILYASNWWKTIKNIDIFHDRGYLFALKTRFGFTIPDNYNRSNYALNNFICYDFIGTSDIASMNSMKKGKSIDNIMKKTHLIKDMTFIYNDLDKIAESITEYDKNIVDEIRKDIICKVGYIRSCENKYTQNDLTKDMMLSVFKNKDIIKLCKNKHLSTDTYVVNHLRNKNIYKIIETILIENLINNED